MFKECSYHFVYCINKCFSHSVIELAKYLFESLIIKQCGKIYLYLIFIAGDIIREGIKSFCQQY